MCDGPRMLEYAFPDPPRDNSPAFSFARLLALGYVAACVAGLLLMGVLMALRV